MFYILSLVGSFFFTSNFFFGCSMIIASFRTGRSEDWMGERHSFLGWLLLFWGVGTTLVSMSRLPLYSAQLPHIEILNILINSTLFFLINSTIIKLGKSVHQKPLLREWKVKLHNEKIFTKHTTHNNLSPNYINNSYRPVWKKENPQKNKIVFEDAFCKRI